MLYFDSKYDFKVYIVEYLDKQIIEDIIEIYRDRLGEYLTRQDLIEKISKKQLFVLCVLDERKKVLGAIAGKKLNNHEALTFNNYLDGFCLPEPTGLLQSLAVSRYCEKSNVGKLLMNSANCYLQSMGCYYSIIEAWDKAVNYHLKWGYKILNCIPDYWFKSSLNIQNYCNKCGSPCYCKAILMGKVLYPNLFENVEIKESYDKGIGVFATKLINERETVLIGKPLFSSEQRTRYSIQVSWDKHMIFDRPAILTNHSCNPNCGVLNNKFGGFDFVALRNIEEGEEINWDYAMTEYESIAIESSSCKCGSYNCRGTVGGWSKLPINIKEKYKKYSAKYLH